MNKNKEFQQAAQSELQKTMLFAERYITRRQDAAHQNMEDAIVLATRDCMISLLSIVRAQYAVVNQPLQVCVGILFKSQADLLFGLEQNPFWQSNRQHLMSALKVAVNDAYDAVDAVANGESALVSALWYSTAGLCALIVSLHHGWPAMRDVSAQMKRDIAGIFG